MFEGNVCLNLDLDFDTPIVPPQPEGTFQIIRNRDEEIIKRTMAILESSIVNLKLLRVLHHNANPNFSRICDIVLTEDEIFLNDLRSLAITQVLNIEYTIQQKHMLNLADLLKDGHFLDTDDMKERCANFKRFVKYIFFELAGDASDQELSNFLMDVSFFEEQHESLFQKFHQKLVLSKK